MKLEANTTQTSSWYVKPYPKLVAVDLIIAKILSTNQSKVDYPLSGQIENDEIRTKLKSQLREENKAH